MGEVLSYILALMGYMGGWCNIFEAPEKPPFAPIISCEYVESARSCYKEGS
jgi:hypothetical protein